MDKKISEVYRKIRDTINTELILIPGEVEGIIKSICGDCNEYLINEVQRYARLENRASLDFITGLVIANPGTTDEFWKQRHNHYKDSENVLRTIEQMFQLKNSKMPEPKKPRRKKPEVNLDLRLADVLIEGESASEVKSWYNFRRHKKIYLGKFLRILQNMGYFNRKLASKEFTIIGRNDFDDATYKDRNDYKPPALKDLWNYPEFKTIPRPKRKMTL
jgi:hypothetical protein